MVKRIKGAIVLMVLLLALSSCASAGSPSARAAMASDLSHEPSGFLQREAGESLQRSRDVNDSQMIAYSVSLELSVRDTEKTGKLIIEQIKHDGGFLVREAENYITARIPSKNMDNFLNNARILGKIERETKTGTDITDQYRDNIIRLDSLKNVRNRYLTLLERANTVTDILGIEKELERVNLEIERLEGRIRHAELSVSYSIITVIFRERAKPGPIGWIFYGLYRGLKWLFVWN